MRAILGGGLGRARATAPTSGARIAHGQAGSLFVHPRGQAPGTRDERTRISGLQRAGWARHRAGRRLRRRDRLAGPRGPHRRRGLRRRAPRQRWAGPSPARLSRQTAQPDRGPPRPRARRGRPPNRPVELAGTAPAESRTGPHRGVTPLTPTPSAEDGLREFAERSGIPVLVARRRHDVLPDDHPLYAGHLQTGTRPNIVHTLSGADLLLAGGSRLGEITVQTVPRSPTSGSSRSTSPRACPGPTPRCPTRSATSWCRPLYPEHRRDGPPTVRTGRDRGPHDSRRSTPGDRRPTATCDAPGRVES